MKKSLLLVSCVALLLSCGGNESAKSDTAVAEKKTEGAEKVVEKPVEEKVVEKLTEKERATINPPGVVSIFQSWSEFQAPVRVLRKNVFSVLMSGTDLFVTSGDKLGRVVQFSEIKPMFKEFMTNPNNEGCYPELESVDIPMLGNILVPKKALCLVEYDSLSTEEFRLKVTEEIYSVYNMLRDSLALEAFGNKFDKCSEDEKNACRAAYLCVVAEYSKGNPPTSIRMKDVVPPPSSSSDIESTEAIKTVVDEKESLEDVANEAIELVPDKNAEFPGGTKAMYKFLSKNIKYPKISLDNGSQGTTTLRIVVEKDGAISSVQVLRSSGDALLDKEAVRVVNEMPMWEPAMKGGKVVRSYFALPVKFICRK